MNEPTSHEVAGFLENEKVWGMLPREMTFLCGQMSGFIAIVLVIAALISTLWWLIIGAGVALLVSIFSFRLTAYFRRVASIGR